MFYLLYSIGLVNFITAASYINITVIQNERIIVNKVFTIKFSKIEKGPLPFYSLHYINFKYKSKVLLTSSLTISTKSSLFPVTCALSNAL